MSPHEFEKPPTSEAAKFPRPPDAEQAKEPTLTPAEAAAAEEAARLLSQEAALAPARAQINPAEKDATAKLEARVAFIERTLNLPIGG